VSIKAWPDRLLSIVDWDAIPEDSSRRYEVAEGVMRVSPLPAARHQRAALKLGSQVERQLPADLEVLPDMEVLLFEESTSSWWSRWCRPARCARTTS
jgi:hypothetical protein